MDFPTILKKRQGHLQMRKDENSLDSIFEWFLGNNSTPSFAFRLNEIKSMMSLLVQLHFYNSFRNRTMHKQHQFIENKS